MSGLEGGREGGREGGGGRWIACEQTQLFGYGITVIGDKGNREPAKPARRMRQGSRPILLASSRLRHPIQMSEPARKLKEGGRD